ncbi:MAG: DUF2313 domain-containing protein [Geosporobacter ferrireducens]|nr:DUF2313 domain-containing protein [Geosporobacter ferrireducens]
MKFRYWGRSALSNLLTKYMSPYYRTSKVITSLTGMEGQEVENFQQKLEETCSQFFVDTATYTLERWERELGIPVNNTKPIAYRRSVITSKLRGSGTVTVELIKNVSESFINGEVEVVENPESYRFTIKFVGVRGIPPNMDDLKKAIEEIKPAHLTAVYHYTYLIWDEYDQANKTWDQWDALNLTWEQLECYKEE